MHFVVIFHRESCGKMSVFMAVYDALAFWRFAGRSRSPALNCLCPEALNGNFVVKANTEWRENLFPRTCRLNFRLQLPARGSIYVQIESDFIKWESLFILHSGKHRSFLAFPLQDRCRAGQCALLKGLVSVLDVIPTTKFPTISTQETKSSHKGPTHYKNSWTSDRQQIPENAWTGKEL